MPFTEFYARHTDFQQKKTHFDIFVYVMHNDFSWHNVTACMNDIITFSVSQLPPHPFINHFGEYVYDMYIRSSNA